MEGSSGWDGENQLVNETCVSLSMPVRHNILVTYCRTSADILTTPPEPPVVLAAARPLGTTSSFLPRAASTRLEEEAA